MSSLYPVKRKSPETYTTEFDILKASHKFLRSDDENVAKSWDAQLAKKYENSLFREFAVCDLKHYKSGNIALRWRTEDEVLTGAGESTCGNTRCPYYDAPAQPTASSSLDNRPRPHKPPKLTTLELPFSYIEQGETELREAMVKVVLCERCVKKLMWKREKDKGRQASHARTSQMEATELNGAPSGPRNDRRRASRQSRSRSPRPYRKYKHAH